MLKSHSNVFIGGAAALDSLSEFDKSNSPILQISGGPGIGKSTLLNQWALLKNYPIIDLSGQKTLQGALSLIASSNDIFLPKMDLETLAIQLKSVNVEMLLLDDLDVFDHTERLLDALTKVGIRAIWSAREAIEIDKCSHFRVEPMRIKDAVALLIFEGKKFLSEIENEYEREPKYFEDLVTALDCVPLALRLIAPRFKSLNPRQMLDYLEERSALVDPKSKTLERAFLSSWEVLDDDAQKLLGLCTSFRGGFEPAAIIALSPNSESVLETVIRASLLEQDSKTGRLRMLWSIRDFATKYHACEVGQNYAQYYLELVENSDDLPVLRKEEFNIRHILHSFLKRDPDISGRASTSLFFLRCAFGPYDDLFEAIKLVISELEHCTDTEVMIDVLRRAGELQRVLGNYSLSLEYFNRALEVADGQQCYYVAGIHMGASGSHRLLEDLDNAFKSATIACEMFQTLGLTDDAIIALIALASVNMLAGDYPGAIALQKQVLEKRPDEIAAYSNIGASYMAIGQAKQARIYLEKGSTLAKNQARLQIATLAYLSLIDLFEGDLDAAAETIQRSMKLSDETQSKDNLSLILFAEGLCQQIREDFVSSFTSFTKILEFLNEFETRRLFKVYSQRGIVASHMGEISDAEQDLKAAELIYLRGTNKHDYIYLQCLRWISCKLYFEQSVFDAMPESIELNLTWRELDRCFLDQKEASDDSWVASCSVFRDGFTLAAATAILTSDVLLIDRLDEEVRLGNLVRIDRGSKLRYKNTHYQYFEDERLRMKHLDFYVSLIARSILPTGLVVERKNLQSALYFAMEYDPEKVNELALMLWLVTGDVHGVPENIIGGGEHWFFASIENEDLVVFSKEVLARNEDKEAVQRANIYYFFGKLCSAEHTDTSLLYLEAAVSLWPEALHIRAQLALVYSVSDAPLKMRHALQHLIDSVAEHNLVHELWTHIKKEVSIFYLDTKQRDHFLHDCGELGFPTGVSTQKIIIDPKKKNVQIEQNDIIDMRRKGTTWRLMIALAHQRDIAPGIPISQPDLFEAVWPGEQFGPTTSSRMYTAIHRVRETVLGDILITEEDGYFLKPSCEIEYLDK